MAKQFNCLRTVSVLLSAAMLATSVPVYSVSAAETQQDEAGIEGTGTDVTTGSAITVQPAEDDSGGDLDTQPEEGDTEEEDEGKESNDAANFSIRNGAPQENEEIDFSTQYTDVVRFTTEGWGGTVGATIKPAYGIIDLSDREEVILEEGVFANNPNITEVRLPNYTWYVGENSFDNCTNLKKFKTGWINCYMCEAEGKILEADDIFGNLDLDELTVSYIQTTPWKNGSWWTPFGSNIHAKKVYMCPYGGYNIMHEDDDGLPQGMTYFEFGEGSTNHNYWGKPLSTSNDTCNVIQLNAKLRYGQNGLTIKNITDWKQLQHLVCKGGIDSSVKRNMVQSNVKFWVYKGSSAETWCINNTRDYGYIDSNGYKNDVLGENVSGGDTEIEEDREASIPDQTIVVNFDNDDAAEIKVDDFGSGKYKIADISYTYLGSSGSLIKHKMSEGIDGIALNKERGSIVLSKNFLKKWLYQEISEKDVYSYYNFFIENSSGSTYGMPDITDDEEDAAKYGETLIKFNVVYDYYEEPHILFKALNIDYAKDKFVDVEYDRGHGYFANKSKSFNLRINNSTILLDSSTIVKDDGDVVTVRIDVDKIKNILGYGKTSAILVNDWFDITAYDSRTGGTSPDIPEKTIELDRVADAVRYTTPIELGVIDFGTLNKAASRVVAVRIDDGYNIPAYIRNTDGVLCIYGEYIYGLQDGEHKIHVVFNDMDKTVVKDKITLKTTGFIVDNKNLYSGQIINADDYDNRIDSYRPYTNYNNPFSYIYSKNSILDLSKSNYMVIGSNSFKYDGVQKVIFPDSTMFLSGGNICGDTVESAVLGFDTVDGHNVYNYYSSNGGLYGTLGSIHSAAIGMNGLCVLPDNVTVTHVGQPYIDIFDKTTNKWAMFTYVLKYRKDKFNLVCNKNEAKYLVGVPGESKSGDDNNYGASIVYADTVRLQNKEEADSTDYNSQQTIVYNKKAMIKDNIQFNARFGGGLTAVDVSVDGNIVDRFHDYNLYASIGKFYSGVTLTSVGEKQPNIEFSQEYLRTLAVGEHDVEVTYSDGSSDTGIKLIIQDEETNEKLPDTVEKEPEQPKDDDTDTSSNPDSDPTVLPVITFQFFKDRPKDVVIPFKATEDVASLNIDDTPTTSYTWDSTNKQLILKSDYLQTLSSGQYRILPKFTSGNIVNNIILEVYDAYADSLLPQLSLTNVDYIQGNIPLTVYMGTGETEATSVDSLVYKGIAIDAKGNMRMFNSNEARIASIDTSRAADEGDLFYIDNAGKLIVTEDAVRLLGLVPGSTYALGCTFNNSVKTASLNRAFITVYNKSEDIPAEDKDAPAVDKDKIDESNGGNTGDSGNTGDGDNTGSGDGGSGSDGGNTGSGDGGNTGGSGDTGNTGSGDSGNTGDSGSGSGSGNTGDGGNTGSGDSGNTGDGENTGSGDSGNTGNTGGSGDSGSGSGSTGGNGGSGTGGTGSGSGSGTGSGSGSTGGTGSTGTGSGSTGSTGGTGSTGTGSGTDSGSNGAGSGNGNGSTGSGSTGSETGNGGTGSGSGFGSTGNGAGSGDEGSGSGTGTGSGSTGTGSTGTGTGTNQAAKKIPNAVFVKKLAVGSSYQIRLINRHKAKSYVYKSSNKKVAVVNSKGLVKVKSEGKAVIKITAKNKKNQKYVYTVIIKAGKGTPVKDTKKNLKNLKCKSTLPIARFIKTVSKGSVYKMIIKSDTKVKYKTGNKRVATVNSKGKIKAVKKGQTHITAVIKQDGIVYKYKILLKVK